VSGHESTCLEDTIRASFEDVWHDRVTSASVSQEVIILSDHDTSRDVLLARASRACSFEIQDPEQQKAWDSLLMREMRTMAERGQVWVGRRRDRRNAGQTDLEEYQRSQPARMDADSDSVHLSSPSVASEAGRRMDTWIL
jgi:hypothetical protein